MRFVCAAILAAVVGGIASAAPIVTDTASYNGHTYYLLSSSSWTDAQAKAVSLGGNLVTVNNAAENAFLYNTWGGGSGEGGKALWIGYNDAAVEGSFVWVSGLTPGYTNWDFGEPNNLGNEDYAYIRPFASGRWNDLADNGSYDGLKYGVVEVVPEPVSVVLFGGLLAGGGWLARRRMKANVA